MSAYGEDQLMQDVRESAKFFEDILEKELSRLKQNIVTTECPSKAGNCRTMK
jgi:hypothetical protein